MTTSDPQLVEPCPYCNGAGCLPCRGRGTVGANFRTNRGLPPYRTPTSDPPKCTATYWVRGKGVKTCTNRATMLGYTSDVTSQPICGRHWSSFRYTGPLQ